MALQGVPLVGQPGRVGQPAATPPQKPSEVSFKDVLKGAVEEVDQLQHDAETSIQNLTAGKVENVHEVMIALDKADMSFRTMMEVRNKLVDAYREVMRMQV